MRRDWPLSLLSSSGPCPGPCQVRVRKVWVGVWLRELKTQELSRVVSGGLKETIFQAYCSRVRCHLSLTLMLIKLVNTDFVSLLPLLLYWRPCIHLLISLCPFLPEIEFNSFWSLTNPIAIVYRFCLTPTDSKTKTWQGMNSYGSEKRASKDELIKL